jgi:hypothetical protein
MEEKNKRKYVKPKVTKIHLDAECAVLGACKTGSVHGPGSSGCSSIMGPCVAQGS